MSLFEACIVILFGIFGLLLTISLFNFVAELKRIRLCLNERLKDIWYKLCRVENSLTGIEANMKYITNCGIDVGLTKIYTKKEEEIIEKEA